jgi:hypothetical protein
LIQLFLIAPPQALLELSRLSAHIIQNRLAFLDAPDLLLDRICGAIQKKTGEQV